MAEIRDANSDAEILACFDVIVHLRPGLRRDAFVARIRAQQAEGFRLAAAWLDGRPVAVAGYRLLNNLFAGRHLYVDDLVTLPELRSQGLGAVLLHALRATAKTEGCRQLHLDSGVQREAAHRFYRQQGLALSAYHFSVDLGVDNGDAVD